MSRASISNGGITRIGVVHLLRGFAVSLVAAALVLAAAPSPARAETPAGCDPRPSAQKLGPSRPINLGLLKRQLVYYRCTRYDAELAAVLRRARAWIERRASRVKRPALVLDIDETSLSNWKRIYQNDFAFILKGPCDFSKGTACGEIAWEQSASAPAIAPTLELFKAAKAKQVTVFFISGRPEGDEERSATEKNLKDAGYDGWERLYLRTEKFAGPSVVPFKSWARSDIEARGYAIIANVGDQWSDLLGGHAERRFKLPDPFYYLP